MKDPLRRAFYLGICAAAVTKRFVEAEVNKYLEEGNITEKEGKKIVDDAMKKFHDDRKQLEFFLKREIKNTVKDAKPALREAGKLAVEVAEEIVKEAQSIAAGKVISTKRRVDKAKSFAKRAKKVTGTARKAAGNVHKRVKRNVKRAKKRVRKDVKKKVKKVVKKRVKKEKKKAALTQK